MSIKRLNSDERATYLLGLAVRRQLTDPATNPEATREILSWVQHCLTDDEVHHLRLETGHIMNDELEKELEGLMELVEDIKQDHGSDDIPF